MSFNLTVALLKAINGDAPVNDSAPCGDAPFIVSAPCSEGRFPAAAAAATDAALKEVGADEEALACMLVAESEAAFTSSGANFCMFRS